MVYVDLQQLIRVPGRRLPRLPGDAEGWTLDLLHVKKMLCHWDLALYFSHLGASGSSLMMFMLNLAGSRMGAELEFIGFAFHWLYLCLLFGLPAFCPTSADRHQPPLVHRLPPCPIEDDFIPKRQSTENCSRLFCSFFFSGFISLMSLFCSCLFLSWLFILFDALQHLGICTGEGQIINLLNK